MDQNWTKAEGVFFPALNENLTYSGRIDFSNPKGVTMYYPSSYVMFRFCGSVCKVVLENKKVWWDNYIGCVIDGEQKKFKLMDSGEECIDLGEGLDEGEHTLMLFKRMDGCHSLSIKGFILKAGSEICKESHKNDRRIEVFGDSVSAGEVSEAVTYEGKEDPLHNGEYSNSWYSYAWITARKLNADLHNISQGGIALLDRTGYFCEPDYIGMEQCYDKLNYHAALGPVTSWNFNKYTPQVVIVAIGQNDSHPEDYMAVDYHCKKAEIWRSKYLVFIRNIRKIYPNAHIILKTTILNHHENWDHSIEEVKNLMADPKVYHFMYANNGKGTPGHIRIREAEKMAEELTAFIESLGEQIWENTKK